MEVMSARINETTLVELLFPYVDDNVTHCQLSQVSRRFNAFIKSKLIKIEVVHFYGTKSIWFESPDGNIHGLFRRWYEGNKQLLVEAHYRHGHLHGRQIEWYPGGQIHVEENYINGQLDGIRYVWHVSGMLERRTFLKNGCVITIEKK